MGDKVSNVAKRLRVSFDPSPLRRIKFIHEDGREELAEDTSSDLRILNSFIHQVTSENQAGDASAVSITPELQDLRPWLPQLRESFQELQIILDIIQAVESSTGDPSKNPGNPNSVLTKSVGLTYVGRARLAPTELAANLAVQVAQNRWAVQEVGRQLAQRSLHLSKNVESRGNEFYRSLTMLQRHFKIHKQRQPSSSSSSSTIFTVDLTFSLPPNMPQHLLTSSLMSLSLSLECGPSGELRVKPPTSRPMRKLQLAVVQGSTDRPVEKEESSILPSAPPPSSASSSSSSVVAVMKELHRIQDSMFDEMLYSDVEKDASTASDDRVVTGMGDSFLNLALPHVERITERREDEGTEETLTSAFLHIELTPTSSRTESVDPGNKSHSVVLSKPSVEDGAKLEPGPRESSPTSASALGIFARQIFLKKLRSGHGGPSLLSQQTKMDTEEQTSGSWDKVGVQSSVLSHLTAVSAHRVLQKSVDQCLQEMATNVPHLKLQTLVALWKPTFSEWHLSLELPLASPPPFENQLENGHSGISVLNSSVTLKGQDVVIKYGSLETSNEERVSSVSDLVSSLLHKLCVEMVSSVYKEAVSLGLEARLLMAGQGVAVHGTELLELTAIAEVSDCRIGWLAQAEPRQCAEGEVTLRDGSEKERRLLGTVSWERLRNALLGLLT